MMKERPTSEARAQSVKTVWGENPDETSRMCGDERSQQTLRLKRPSADSMAMFKPLHGTFAGALLGHCILIPLWTLSPFLNIFAMILLLCGGRYSQLGLLLCLIFGVLMSFRFGYETFGNWLPKMFYNLGAHLKAMNQSPCSNFPGPHLVMLLLPGRPHSLLPPL